MKAQTQRRVRQIHHYLGIFFAPAIIFFALSGALQTFRLQEDKGWGGTPPNWIVWLAAIHKDQAPPRAKPVAVGPVTGAALAEAPEKPRARPPAAPRKSKLPMQVFTVVMAAGLIFSALLGIAIALNNRAMRRGAVVMLVLGALVPIVLI